MPNERITFRYSIGVVVILGGLGGLAGLYFIPIPEGNREPLLLALGLVLGWGGTVVGYEFGSSPAGRQAAAVGVRLAEKDVPPTGTPENPTIVEGAEDGAAVTTRLERK